MEKYVNGAWNAPYDFSLQFLTAELLLKKRNSKELMGTIRV